MKKKEGVKKSSILKSTLQVTGILLIVKLLGVLKQSLIAAYCGANADTDAYFVATGIITALCSVVFSSISISLLSIHTERKIIEGRESSNNLINAVLRVFLPVSAGITVVFALSATGIARFLAPSYDGTQLETLAGYIRILSLMFVFSCYYLILNVVLETDKRFLPGKGQNLLQNLFICVSVLFVYPKRGMSSLIYAFLLAGFVQCIQITWNARNEFKLIGRIRPEKKTIRNLTKIALPLLIGNAIYEINDIVDKQIATVLGEGNVSYLSYGASINEIVTTLIIQSVSTVLFSHYATWVAEGETEKVADNLKKTMENLVALIMPVMVMCFICGDCIVDILYGRGNFGDSSILMTSGVVCGYAAGFLFQAARANLVRIFYAFKDTKTPMINGAVSIAINIILSLTLSRLVGVGGIALATSMAMLLVSCLLLPGVRKYLPGFNLKSSIPEYLKAVTAAVCIGIAAFLLRKALQFGSVLCFIVIGIFTVSGYLMLAYALNLNAVRNAAVKLLSKVEKKKH